ncbi:hypothetical protein C8J56DRAFT_1025633 [Mycena floridula]|nr:hypothetical protein C8J56DRAFT_1025633 [Mycena floridula]
MDVDAGGSKRLRAYILFRAAQEAVILSKPREVTDGVNIHLLQRQSTSRHRFQSRALRYPIRGDCPVQGGIPARQGSLRSSVQGVHPSRFSSHQRNAHATYCDEVEGTNRMGDANEDEEGEGDGEQARKIEVVKFLGLSSGFSVM